MRCSLLSLWCVERLRGAIAPPRHSVLPPHLATPTPRSATPPRNPATATPPQYPVSSPLRPYHRPRSLSTPSGSFGSLPCLLAFHQVPGGGERRLARRHRFPASDADGSLSSSSRVDAQWPVNKGQITEAGVFNTGLCALPLPSPPLRASPADRCTMASEQRQ